MTSGNARDDELWFDGFFRSHLAQVWSYAARRVGDPDDVVSEVFATAWRNRSRLPDPPDAWLLRTASNYVLHANRSYARRSRLFTRASSVRLDNIGDHADQVVSNIDAQVGVRAALRQLSPADREVLTLSAWEQLGPIELAIVLDCTPAAAKVRLHRARRRLAAILCHSESQSPARSPWPMTKEASV